MSVLRHEIGDPAGRGRSPRQCPHPHGLFCRADAIYVLQIVTLPYNLVLQKSAREALGIDLTDQILVIDEAHSESPRPPPSVRTRGLTVSRLGFCPQT